jgi:hypothetical protein
VRRVPVAKPPVEPEPDEEPDEAPESDQAADGTGPTHPVGETAQITPQP